MVNLAQYTPYQRASFCTVVVLVSLGSFFMYNNVDLVLKSDFLKVLHGHIVPENTTGDEDTREQTVVLIWLWPFGSKFNVECSGFDLKGLHFTDDRSLYSIAHVVLFHHRDLRGDLSNMPKEPRPWFQKWVWWNKESPVHCRQIPEAKHLFNMTSNYRLDSTVPARYGMLVQRTHPEENFKIPAKDKLVCWIVSNWNGNHKRVQFFNELKKHINISTYGGAFGKRISSEEAAMVMPSCKFYLSFENSIFQDYITEKMYKPLTVGTVPVVLGPSRRNYEQHVPRDSFIHFEDFDSPKALADRLHYLDKNPEDYMRYFTWRRHFEVQHSSFGLDVCLIYAHLKHAPGFQEIEDLNKWFWG